MDRQKCIAHTAIFDRTTPRLRIVSTMFNCIIRQSCRSNLISCKLSRSSILPQSIRYASDSAAYGGDGKTTVRVLNDEEPNINLVNTYSNKGFRLSNNLFINGSILLFPTHVYSWNVRRGIDITPESLIVFDLIVPKIKIIVIGYGQQDEPFDASLPMKLKKKGISCEVLPTPNAVTTYNYLVADSVHVAGAFVPVRDIFHMTNRDTRGLHEWDEMYGERKYPSAVERETEEHVDRYLDSQKISKNDKFDK